MTRTKENLMPSLMKTSQLAESMVRSGMRTKLNLSSSPVRRIPGKLAVRGVSLSSMPLGWFEKNWLDSGVWRLPSGKPLAEFALQSGFLAPLLFDGGQFGAGSSDSGVRRFERERGAAARTKQAEKGSNH